MNGINSPASAFDKSVILVTGGAGFVGSDFVLALIKDPQFQGRVINFDKVSEDHHPENLTAAKGDPAYSFIQGDCHDLPLLEKLVLEHKIDMIVHFAGETSIETSLAHPENHMKSNFLATFTMLELVRKYPHVYLHDISSASVYGNYQLDNAGFTEDSPWKPSSPYAASKACASFMTLSYQKSFDLNITLSHTTNVYGSGQTSSMLIYKVLDSCLNGNPIILHGDGSQTRDWLFVGDHTKALFKILKARPIGEEFILGTGCEITNLDMTNKIIELVSELKDKPKEEYTNTIKHVDDISVNAKRSKIDASKMKAILGWTAEQDLSEGLRNAVTTIARKHTK